MDIGRQYRRLKRWTRVWGLTHACPLCHRPLSTFHPAGVDAPVFQEKQIIGGGLRSDAKCFVCGSLDRERLIYLYLKHFTDVLTRPTKMLHIAPEVGLQNKLRKHRNIDYLSGDLCSVHADIKLDITDMPFENGTFDYVIANHVLEHVHDDHLAMSEIRRILKPGSGKAILQVPISLALDSTYEDATKTSEQERLEAFGQEDHVRLYGTNYAKLLEQRGFLVSPFNWWTSEKLNPQGENRFGLLANETLYVASV